MRSRLYFSRLLLAFVCGWLVVSSWAADEPDAIAPQPAEDPAPVIQPPKKKVRHRAPPRHISRNARVEIGKDVTVRAGEVVPDLVVIAGNATIDGTVEGSLTVLSGSARINGQIKDGLVTVLGSAALGPEASVGNDVVVVGGHFKLNPKATVGGQQTTVTLGHAMPDFVWLQSWLAQGLFLARPFPPQVRWVWIAAGICLVLYLALTLMFPTPVRACVTAVEQQPVVSFFVGLLLFVLLGPLLFLLVVSVAGILVIPFVVCALVAATLFGKIAVYSYAGQQVSRQFPALNLTLPGVLLLGFVLFYILYMVPILGFAVWGVVTLIGFGAVLLASFGSFRRDEPSRPVPFAMGAGAGADPFPTADLGTSTGAFPPMLAPSDVVLLPRVGFWRRFCAASLDFILLGLLLHVTGPFFIAVWAGYHVAMWAWKGTTIGGIVMNIKVVRTDGQPVDFAVALVRSLSSFFSAFALFLGFFWAGWDRERQAWHDKIAGTVVVKVPKGMSLI